jgi:hypothetical protein
MRYLYTFLLLFCLSILTLTAQDIKNPKGDEKIQGSTDLVDQIITYHVNPERVYRNTYDYTTDFRLRSIIQDFLHNGYWEHATKTTYTLDSINYMYNKSDSVWYEGQWHIRQSYTSKYNSNWQLLEYLDELYYVDTLYRSYRTTHTLDSIGNILVSFVDIKTTDDWFNWYRSTYKYDENKNVLDSLKQNCNNGQWVNDYNYIYTYDLQGNMVSSCENYWLKDKWIKFNHEIMTYYSSNKLHTYFYEEWDLDKLVKSYRNTYTYDENGKSLTNLYEGLINNQWINLELYTYTYNSNDNILTKSFKVWKHDNWQDSTRESYVYDLNNNELSHLTENWVGDHWVNSEIYLSSYDFKGKVLTEVDKFWENEQWVIDHSFECSYNDYGILHIKQHKQWHNQLLSSLEKYTYSNTGKELSELYESWEDGKLSGSTRLFFTYDANDNFILGTCEELDSGKWVNLNGYFQFEDSRNKYFFGDGYKVEVIYKTISLVKENIFDINLFLTCSPNPSAGQLNINYNLSELAITSISISNISGFEVANIRNNQMQLPGSYTTIYDASKLTPGTYFITLIAGSKRVTSKFIINY